MGRVRNITKKLAQPVLSRWLKFHYRKPRPYRYEGIEVMVHPDVFPPQLTLSTKILLDFISEINLESKTFLELGCGSGIISLYAAKKGAKVTASDINKTALDYLKSASESNRLTVHCVHSNLFANISEESFDYIFINPPYYPKTPSNVKEEAWYCGEDFQYFHGLFGELGTYISEESKGYMILSEDCDIARIEEIASDNHIEMNSVFETNKLGEKNYIFRLKKKGASRNETPIG